MLVCYSTEAGLELYGLMRQRYHAPRSHESTEYVKMTIAKRIDGKAKAEQLAESITAQAASLLGEHGITPGLAVVIIGEDPASQVYVRNKKRRA